MKKIIIFILLSFMGLTLSGVKIADLPSLSKPEKIVIKGDKFYVTEEAFVYIFSMNDYRLLKKYGRRGDGPGELNPQPRYKLFIEAGKDDILVNSYSKMVFLSDLGEYKGEKRIPFIAIQIIPIEQNLAITKSVISRQSTNNSIAVIFFDKELNPIKTAYNRQYPNYNKSGKIDILPSLLLIKQFRNKIFSFDQKGDFVIDVFNSSGDRINQIKTKCKSEKMTKEYIDKTWEWSRNDIRLRSLTAEQRRMVYFPDYFPVMKNFEVDDNRIYVHTYRMKYDENSSEFIIIDFQGKILKKRYFMGSDINTIECAPYTFKNDKYIHLLENPNTEMIELHIENAL